MLEARARFGMIYSHSRIPSISIFSNQSSQQCNAALLGVLLRGVQVFWHPMCFVQEVRIPNSNDLKLFHAYYNYD